ncbi:MAG: hypothetical protein HC796_00690 [Synechococcaceae cyanobacterium RL_1_2]|nr:hypothetical protein [Synechococcaceae cyanobacterium RL_1_2]
MVVTDTLPQGFNILPDSVKAELRGEDMDITVTNEGQKVIFTIDETFNTNINDTVMVQGETLALTYAAEVTPDAIRGTGKNLASVNAADVSDRNRPVSVSDGPAIHTLRLNRGILSDYGIIVGRVFVDKNFDGEQQPGEAGIPNAVVYLQDGNRVSTDAEGMFSLRNVLPGYYTGTVDFTSIPGYTLAPNLVFSEKNSQSRLVHLSPGVW